MDGGGISEAIASSQARVINAATRHNSIIMRYAIGSARHSRTQSETSPKPAAPPQQLSPESQAALLAAIEAGNLPELRWPDFSDYSKLVKKFYESYGYSLPWVRGMQPTTQAPIPFGQHSTVA
jgi:hypothetical protein